MTDHIVDANKLVRAEFEAWAHKTHYNLGVGPNGLYQSGNTSSAWRAWQAATQRQQERIAYVEKVADDAIELGNQQAIRIAELEAQVSKLTSYVANCRDAFPVPATGSDLETDWIAAMADPDQVPEYVRAQVQALSLDAGRWRFAASHNAEGRLNFGVVYDAWDGDGSFADQINAAIAAGKGGA